MQLKLLADQNAIACVVTGSSALRIELGPDTLAGRFNAIEVGTLSLTEIGKFRKLATPELLLPANGMPKSKTKDFWQALKRHGKAN